MSDPIPPLKPCGSRMTMGERRFAKWLNQKLDSAYVLRAARNACLQLLVAFGQELPPQTRQSTPTWTTCRYRNTRQILQTASQIAGGLLTAQNSEQGEDGIPLLLPVSCGREGPEPMVINLPTLHEEAAEVAELLSAAHQEGHAWGDMAVLCRHYDGMEACARALVRRRLPHRCELSAAELASV